MASTGKTSKPGVPKARVPAAKAKPALPVTGKAPVKAPPVKQVAAPATPQVPVAQTTAPVKTETPVATDTAPAAIAATITETTPAPIEIARDADIIEEIATGPAPAASKGKIIMVENVEKFTAQAKEAAQTATTKIKEAAEKSMAYASEAGAFTKANAEAVVESGKIAVEGVQALSRENLEYAKSNFETATAAAKELASVKTPTEFFQLQSDNFRKSFDTLVAQTSKNSEAFLKLTNEAFQPISSRFAVAMDSAKKAA